MPVIKFKSKKYLCFFFNSFLNKNNFKTNNNLKIYLIFLFYAKKLIFNKLIQYKNLKKKLTRRR